jgi:hypothetical protein
MNFGQLYCKQQHKKNKLFNRQRRFWRKLMNSPTYSDVIASADLAATAELAYVDRSGLPRIMSTTPMLMQGEPVVTLTYADAELAREVSASPEVCLVFSDSRLAYAGWTPLAAPARAVLAPDPEGEDFQDYLLDQELRKFPPSRQYVDSILLRRENWWYLPRLILHLRDLDEPVPIGRRNSPEHGVVAWRSDSGLLADTVRVDDWESDRIPLRSLAGNEAVGLADAPAGLFYHDFSVPDMELRTSFLATGRLTNGRLRVEERAGSRRLGKMPGILARWQAQRQLKKRCEAGIDGEG